jgi:[ribosomal protein S18]-alanine N-acetyltransferase
MSTITDHKASAQVYIRWRNPIDMPFVLAIEKDSFEFPWTEADFHKCLQHKMVICMVAEHNGIAVGFMVYELRKTRIHILNFAVAKEHRRRAVGSQMIAKLKAKLCTQRRRSIVLEVRETNLAAQLFFRELGFKAIAVKRRFYQDTPEDAYLMTYNFGQQV